MGEAGSGGELRDDRTDASLLAAAARCFVCGTRSERPPVSIAGLRGEPRALVARVCSETCLDAARRFAARRSAQLGPARAGLLVATLGLAVGLLFLATGRDMGRPLLVLSLFGAGTTRLAYPDAVPSALARRLGLATATELLQWAGVVLAMGAVALGIAFAIG